MNPAFSVIFLTTLIGAGQGLFLALYTGESYAVLKLLPVQHHDFYIYGSALSVLLLIAGLVASIFHLGHPERAWRSAARWRTSWLSREVLVLPAVITAVAVYGLLHFLEWDLDVIGIKTNVPGALTLLVGTAGMILTFALFICTAMIYACIKFLQEWATPLTIVNYILLGTASGFTLATAFASHYAPGLTGFYGVWTLVIIFAALISRVATLIRNARLRPISTLRSAIGVRHSTIRQLAQGFMGGSFNTREFFHGALPWVFKSIKWIFLLLVFPLPMLLIVLGMKTDNSNILLAAFVIQYAGLVAERWFFFAQANHPQNLYYQTIS